MFEFLVIVAAILVAQTIVFAVGFMAVCSPKVQKWYTKKVFEMTKNMEKEMAVLFEKDEL